MGGVFCACQHGGISFVARHEIEVREDGRYSINSPLRLAVAKRGVSWLVTGPPISAATSC